MNHAMLKRHVIQLIKKLAKFQSSNPDDCGSLQIPESILVTRKDRIKFVININIRCNPPKISLIPHPADNTHRFIDDFIEEHSLFLEIQHINDPDNIPDCFWEKLLEYIDRVKQLTRCQLCESYTFDSTVCLKCYHDLVIAPPYRDDCNNDDLICAICLNNHYFKNTRKNKCMVSCCNRFFHRECILRHKENLLNPCPCCQSIHYTYEIAKNIDVR